MTGQHRGILPIMLVLLLVFDVSAWKAVGLPGGWTPIDDPKDAHIQQLGEYAVSEHNKAAKTNLHFQQVVSGETQVVAGANYRLLIAAGLGGITNRYEAVVWEKTWSGFRNLTSFKHV